MWRVALPEAGAAAVLMVRSLADAAAESLAGAIVRLAAGHGFAADKTGPYPGWKPDPASPLLAVAQRVHARLFGGPARPRVIHAGLECGLLAASHPHLDMLSFGPYIRGAHAPGERVRVESVAHCWTLLQALLAALRALRGSGPIDPAR